MTISYPALWFIHQFYRVSQQLPSACLSGDALWYAYTANIIEPDFKSSLIWKYSPCVHDKNSLKYI